MSAILSPDGRFRYELRRTYRPRGMFAPPQRGLFVVIGLNPSRADATEDDPTIRRCRAFAEREGCATLVMLNLFALRATEPADLIAWLNRGEAPFKARKPDRDPDAPADEWLVEWTYTAEAVARVIREVRDVGGYVVAAWGALADHRHVTQRAANIAAMVTMPICGNLPLRCLGTTKEGHPRHPLYLRADAPLVPWSPT